ncbi:BspA family leucine-rich repeat surface protein [Ekhidna sp.]|uniref:BspA family leucine-rich repeat surface protein n=1 Tax=Ekhidna sp. TaxID=2608089 RepID=UPI003B5BD71B
MAIPDAASLDITSDLTIETWVKFSSVVNEETVLVSKWNPDDTPEDRSYLLQVSGTSDLGFAVSTDGTTGAEGVNFSFVSANYSFTAGRWYHIAGTYSPSNALRIYVNGELIGENTTNIMASIHNSNSSVVLGANGNFAEVGVGNVSTGVAMEMDETRIWSIEKSQADIQTDMFNTLTGSITNLNASYTCNYTSGTTLSDDGSLGNNGTLNDNNNGTADGITAGPIWGNSTVYDADVVAPFNISGYPFVDNITENGFQITTQLSEVGTLSYVVLTDGASVPGKDDIRGGTGFLGAPAEAFGTINVSTPLVDFSDIVSGLSPLTNYDVYMVAEDLEGVPNVQINVDFFDVTTNAAPVQNALDFDGTDDYVIGTGINLASSDFTVEAWFNTNDVTATQSIFSLGNAGTNNQSLHINLEETQVLIGFFFDDVAIPYTVPTGWNHIAVTHNATTRESSLYINGQFIGSGTHSGNFTGNTDFTISRNAWDAFTGFFNGQLDELRVWNDIRSETEIAFNRYTEIDPVPESNLVAYYQFNEASGTLLPDSKNSNGGTWNGSGGGAYTTPQWIASTALDIPPYIVTNTNDSGTGSLRDAITHANANPGTSISFLIGEPTPWQIDLSTALPSITAAGTIIDGSTQPGWVFGDPNNMVTINGSSVGTSNGIEVSDVANVEIYGLIITGFSGTGSTGAIIINGENADGAVIGAFDKGNIIHGNTSSNGIYIVSGDNATIQGNWIGTLDGTSASANGHGIRTTTNVDGLLIGGDFFTGEGNVISGAGPSDYGIQIVGSDNVDIRGNLIGTNATGTGAIPNLGGGIILESGATFIAIGGPSPSDQNIISGNNSRGIYVLSATDVDIDGNLIGLEGDGISPLGNTGNAILLSTSPSNINIGLQLANKISYNDGYGIFYNGLSSLQGPAPVNEITCNTSGGIGFGSTPDATPPTIDTITPTEATVSTTAADGSTVTVWLATDGCSNDQGVSVAGTGVVSSGQAIVSGSFSTGEYYTAYVEDVTLGTSPFSASYFFASASSFITTWSTSDGTITIPTNSGSYSYNYDVTWTNLTNTGVGDGSLTSQTGDALLSGLENGSTYQVEITGTFPAIYFFGGSEATKLLTVEQWGSNSWVSMANAFNGCSNLTIPAVDAPDLSGVTSLARMFEGASSLTTEDFSGWDVSTINDMSRMFEQATNFNGNVTNWNVSNVSNMSFMFFGASTFNQDISGWTTSSLSIADAMFRDASSFDQPIGSWSTTNLTSAPSMFYNATVFNRPLSGWDVSQLTELYSMFENAVDFDQDLSSWDVSLVTDFSFMFSGATSFAQDLSSWMTTSAQNMDYMFSGASSFNSDLSGWNVESVAFMEAMLDNTAMSIANYDATLIGWGSQTVQSGVLLGANGLTYSSAAQSAHDELTGTNSWTIVGDMLDAGESNNALNFDRTDDYVDLGNPPILQQGDDLTLEAWVYWNGDNSQPHTIISRATSGEASADNVLYLFQINSDGRVRLFYEYDAGLDVDAYSTNAIPTNTWVHVAVTRETGPSTAADTRTRFYINGQLDGEITGQEDPWDGGGGHLVWIGATNQTGSERYFGGSIDELRIWNIERTQGDIEADMNVNLTGLESGLLAYYDFNQGTAEGTNTGETTLFDLSSNAINGTLNGFALSGTSSNWVTSGAQDGGGSSSDFALDFDGTDDHLVAPDITELGITDGTIEAWVNPASLALDGGSVQRVLAKPSSTGNESSPYQLVITDGGAIRLTLGNGGSSVSYDSNTGLVQTGIWQHIAVTWDGSNVRFYYDGVEDLVFTQTITPNTNTSSLIIGGFNGISGSGQFNGAIDDVRIWDFARNETAINDTKDFYLIGDETGLVAYYPMSDGTGSTIASDKSNFVNDATLTNMAENTDWVDGPGLINSGGGSSIFEDFESGTVPSADYSGTLSLGSGDWESNSLSPEMTNVQSGAEAISFNQAGDYLQSFEIAEGVTDVSFFVNQDNGDGGELDVLYSTDGGSSFNSAGQTGLFTFTAYEEFIIPVGTTEPTIIRIEAVTTNEPVYLDDITINVNDGGSGPTGLPRVIYFTTPSATDVNKVEINGGIEESLVASNSGVGDYGIAYSAFYDRVYYIDGSSTGDKIMSVQSDGQAVQEFADLGTSGAGGYGSLALDTVSNVLYAVTPTGLQSFDLADGTPITNYGDILIGSTGSVSDIEVYDGNLFWSQSGLDNGIAVASLSDISGTSQLIVDPSVTGFIQGLTIDPLDNRLYWTTGGGEIRSANFDGSDESILVDGLSNLEDLEMNYENRHLIYVTDNLSSTIEAIDTEGTPQGTLLSFSGSINYIHPYTTYSIGAGGSDFYEDFDSGLTSTTDPSFLLESGTWLTQGVKSAENPALASGGEGDAAYIFFGTGNYLVSPTIENSTYVTFDYRADPVSAGTFDFDVYASDDGGSTFTNFLGSGSTGGTEYIQFNYNFGTEYTGPIQIIYTGTGSESGLIDNFNSDGSEIPVDVTYTTLSIPGGGLSPGSTDNLIYGFSIAPADDVRTIGVILTLDDSNYLSGDFPANPVKLWSNTTDDFGSAAEIGNYDFAGTIPEGPTVDPNQVALLFEDVLTGGTTTYYYVTIDVDAGALVGNSLSVQPINFEQEVGIEQRTNQLGSLNGGNLFTIQAGSFDPPNVLAATGITSTEFTANWEAATGAIGYFVDVATDAAFTKILPDYEDFDAETNVGLFVSNLDFRQSYYYRVRADYGGGNVSVNSAVESLKTDIDAITLADSLALVQIYDAVSPQGLNWESARLRDWDGVVLNLAKTRVRRVDFPSTGAVGEMPNPFAAETDPEKGPLDMENALSVLNRMNVSNNEISGLMDFAPTAMNNLNVSGNSLTFGDLEPLMSLDITTLNYANQASIQFLEDNGGEPILEPHLGDPDLEVITDGSDNVYTWYRNDVTISSGTEFGIFGGTLVINDIDYENMGEFRAEVTNNIVTGLVVDVDPQIVYATADVTMTLNDLDGDLLNGETFNGALLEAIRRDAGYDTLERAPNVDANFVFNDVVLGDYLCGIDPLNRDDFIPTYFGDAFEWELAEVIELRANTSLDIRITEVPPVLGPGDGEGTLDVLIEEDFGDEDGRLEARRRAKKRKCGLKRRRRGGRTDQDEFELIAYGETDDNGEFQFGFLPQGEYRFFVEYPGIPLDESAFVEFEVGEAGVSDTDFKLQAFATEDGIEVTIEAVLGVILEYFKDLAIYPNPSDEYLNIRYRHLKSNYVTAQLVDLAGNTLWTSDLRNGFDGEVRIDVTGYEEGMYILRFYDREQPNENVVSFRVLVKE